MDAAEQDPIESIVKLARGMMPDRRSRFLDAACGGQPHVRAEVEASLNAGGQPEAVESAMNSAADEMGDSPTVSIESVAEEALAAAEDSGKSREARGNEPTLEDEPIDVYCDGKRLDVPARLRLFQQVCLLVHQAHQRGRIHGGLSARQIQVAPEGTPRIRGHEKDDPAAEGMLHPDEISPEQVLGEPATTATDIYALGLLLYKLLTGHHPYQIPAGEESEIYKAVSEQPPERPSLAVNRTDRANPESSRQTSEVISAARGTTPRKLSGCLPAISN